KGSLSRIVLTSDGELAAFIADQKLQIAKTANSATPITVNAAPDNTMVPDYPAPLSPFVGAYAWQTGPTTLIVEYKNSVVDTETIIGYAFINPETGERKSFQVYAQTGNSVFAPSGRAALVNNYKSPEPSLSMVNLSTNKNYFDLIKLPNPQMGDTPVYVPPLIHWAQNGSQAFVAFFEPATTDSRDPCLTNCKVVLYSISTSGEVNRLGNLPASYENDEFPVISFSGSGQWVAYTVGTETHIYDPAKREDRLVLPEPAAEISWAAGSERFAVISTSGNGYIIGTDGKTESFGRSGETIGTLNWADSNTLVYLQSDNGRWDIFVKNIGETPMLIFNQLGKYFPAQLFALPAQ
ncbi:MAG: hypothetical protein HGA53_01470, partial [Anaerolineaceae bacterium]|nr:hypothetical protein [Anaerolineaceae bacterium]